MSTPLLAKWMLPRTGAERIKHFSTTQLWARGAVQPCGSFMRQGRTWANRVADLLTHSVGDMTFDEGHLQMSFIHGETAGSAGSRNSA